MKRRTFLGGVCTAAATVSPAAPTIAMGTRELKLVCSFLEDPLFELFGQTVTRASGGRLRVSTFYPGELVDSFEVFDAVSEGVADMYWSTDYYWQDRSPAYNFFTTVPYGFTRFETLAWLRRGGGQALWDELGARFNIKPLVIGNSGNQMGGWFTREVESIDDFRGLRYRIPGLGGEVMTRLGAVVVNLPPGEIAAALGSGALDAAEWVGPIDDFIAGLHETEAKHYYYPGFHEPGAVNALGINRGVWESLSAEDRAVIEAAAAATYMELLADLDAVSMQVLQRFVDEHGVKLRKFDDAILRRFGEVSGEVVAEVGNSDPFTRRVYESYMAFHTVVSRWTDISVRAYLNARALDFPYGSSA